jgi:ABC-2 type transport system ATP-binding protein
VTDAPARDPAIEVRGLTRRFGTFTAVDAISFDVAAGEVFGFLGANGAGKTTAIRMLIGLLAPSGGSARVAGFDVATQAESVKRNIGYMSQRFSLYEDLTVRENITLYGGIYGLSDRAIADRMASLVEHLDLGRDLDTRVKSIPLGWKQKLAFSVAVLHDPTVVFLDEPTGGVDPITRRQFWELIYSTAAQGTTVFVTTHYMDEAEYCDRVSIMVDGRIAALVERLDLGRDLDTRVKSIPLGWKQKLAFSVAVLHDPKVVFLDEPTGGVDPITRRQFWELIYSTAAQGTTMFVTTHYMDEAEYCDRVSIMVDGRIAALGTPTELKARFASRSIDDVFVRLARPGAAA